MHFYFVHGIDLDVLSLQV